MWPPLETLLRETTHLLRLIRRLVVYCFLPLTILLVAFHFPYDTDASAAQPRSARNFYETAYGSGSQSRRGLDYEETSARVASASNIEGQIKDLVTQYGLHDKRILDVGSGRGYLQDIVADYTGLDLSSNVAPLYHKPFVVGSATEMPFGDDTFDAIWSVWVVEHISEPEKVFVEMRRVIKPNGVLLLFVAWNCPPWAAGGFEVRPYSDFTLPGKLVKASIPVRGSALFEAMHRVPTRTIRWAQYAVTGARTRLHFRALQPNYEIFWQPDSDAAVSLDQVEAMLWFESRGDSCLNCGSLRDELLPDPKPLVVRVNK